jgi:acetyl-CoA carboxylase carboxyltransferase component
MGSKHHGADFNFAYPTAEIAVMGPEGAVNIVYRKELAEAEDKTAAYNAFVDEYRNKVATPYRAAELGYIDEIIKPNPDPRKAGQGPKDPGEQAHLPARAPSRQPGITAVF